MADVHYSISTDSPSRPGFLGWLFTFISLPACCALSFVAVGIAWDYRSMVGYSSLDDALSHSNYARANGYADIASNSFLRVLLSTTSEVEDVDTFVVHSLLDTALMLHEGEARAAQERITALESYLTPSPTRGSRASNPVTSSELPTLNELVEIQAEVSALEIRLQSLAERRKKVSTRVSLLVADISELLGLDASQFETTKFYQRGVLAGFPAHSTIPDGMGSYLELRDALEAAGGSVSLSGADAQQQFAMKLSDSRALASNLRDEMSSLTSEETTSKRALSAYKRTLRIELQRKERTIHELVLKMLRLSPSPFLSILQIVQSEVRHISSLF